MIWKGSLREDDPEQQIRIIEQFVSEGVGGIVLAPIDDTKRSCVQSLRPCKRESLW